MQSSHTLGALAAGFCGCFMRWAHWALASATLSDAGRLGRWLQRLSRALGALGVGLCDCLRFSAPGALTFARISLAGRLGPLALATVSDLRAARRRTLARGDAAAVRGGGGRARRRGRPGPLPSPLGSCDPTPDPVEKIPRPSQGARALMCSSNFCSLCSIVGKIASLIVSIVISQSDEYTPGQNAWSPWKSSCPFHRAKKSRPIVDSAQTALSGIKCVF